LEGGAIHLNSVPSDVEDIIGAALEQLDDRLGNRPVQINVPENFPLLSLDFSLIVQVLMNVIENAIKYSHQGSSIEIAAQEEGDWISITVADRGIGIPKEDLDRVFDKFYRIQNPDNISGTGLGLAIVKSIIEYHQGRIWVNSQIGHGTTFTVVLPIADDK
jgi:two-component system sensor histidine kinase KdpD